MATKLRTARRVAGFGTTIFTEINALAQRHHAVNLGQGAPDFDGPPEVLAAAVSAVNSALNQYAPGAGLKIAREAIARHAERFYGQKIDPDTEVLVTTGATEGRFAAILGLTDPDDEVIVFQPVYDTYVPNLVMAGVTPRYVTLRGKNWTFDRAELAGAFNARTRAIIVNTPHNPTGKVFSKDELSTIAGLCVQHDVIAITDEVYEHILYDRVTHTRLATLPGMGARTVTISSLGKTFSVTGWKVGWAIGAPPLVQAVNQAHQFITFAVATPFQAAAVRALDLPLEYYESLRADYQLRRDHMIDVLSRAGFKVSKPQGSYFIMADWCGLAPENVHDDVEFARWLIQTVGVACIPPSFFYQEADKEMGRSMARFAVCKKNETLDAAAERLSKLRRV
jgi:N-succinyldiaminopimelate aminotransferase